MNRLLVIIVVLIILPILIPKMNKSLISLAPTPSLNPLLSTPFSPSTDLNSFTYPSSKVINSDNNSLILESNDSASVITNWYKEQIQTEGMKTTSFVQTRTNGNVLNRLVGSNSYRKIDVEIRKKSDQPEVRMTIYVN